MRKVLALILIVASLVILTSCSSMGNNSTDTETVYTAAPSRAPIYGHDEFRYDGDVGWDTFYSELIEKYGTPSNIAFMGKSVTLIYNNPTVAGIKFSGQRRFWMDNESGRISLIQLVLSPESIQNFNTLKDSIIQKYGDPTDAYENGYCRWDNVYDETVIQFIDNYATDSRVRVEYSNQHIYEIEERYTDLPTPTPTPELNLQGI